MAPESAALRLRRAFQYTDDNANDDSDPEAMDEEGKELIFLLKKIKKRAPMPRLPEKPATNAQKSRTRTLHPAAIRPKQATKCSIHNHAPRPPRARGPSLPPDTDTSSHSVSLTASYILTFLDCLPAATHARHGDGHRAA
jgi:hypothetical protein